MLYDILTGTFFHPPARVLPLSNPRGKVRNSPKKFKELAERGSMEVRSSLGGLAKDKDEDNAVDNDISVLLPSSPCASGNKTAGMSEEDLDLSPDSVLFSSNTNGQ